MRVILNWRIFAGRGGRRRRRRSRQDDGGSSTGAKDGRVDGGQSQGDETSPQVHQRPVHDDRWDALALSHHRVPCVVRRLLAAVRWRLPGDCSRTRRPPTLGWRGLDSVHPQRLWLHLGRSFLLWDTDHHRVRTDASGGLALQTGPGWLGRPASWAGAWL